MVGCPGHRHARLRCFLYLRVLLSTAGATLLSGSSGTWDNSSIAESLISQAECNPIPFGHVPIMPGNVVKVSAEGRYMASNHKTGTYLKNCLVRITTGEHVSQVYSASNHIAGGFRPYAWQVNFVRDPFIMVDSGFIFHRRDSELWCHQPLNAMVKGMFSVPFAAKTWNQYFFEDGGGECGMQPRTLQIDLQAESYSQVLSRFPLVSGLTMEILRVVLFDATVMVQSVNSCLEANQPMGEERGRGDSPACINVLLDDVMEAGVAALDEVLVPQLRLQDSNLTKLREDYLRYCTSISRRAKGHSSVVHQAESEDEEELSAIDAITGTTRQQRVDIIEQLDRIYFGGTLSKYRNFVLQSVHRPPTNSTAAQESLKWYLSGPHA